MTRISPIRAIGTSILGSIAGFLSAIVFLIAFTIAVPFILARALVRQLTADSATNLPVRPTSGS